MLKENPKVIIPNFFTSMNMIIGFISIYFSYTGQFEKAAWVILLSVIMDKLDGTTARLFNASSEFGVQFDSFSDFFSFGIAPSLLYLFYLNSLSVKPPFYIFAASALYILFSAWRLAHFNVKGVEDGDYFRGLTTTQSGAMLGSFMLICLKYKFPFLMDANLVSGMLLAHGILLISPFKYPKFKKREKKWLNVAQTLSFVILIGLVLIRKMPEIIYLSGVLYILIGYINCKFKKDEDHAEAGN